MGMIKDLSARKFMAMWFAVIYGIVMLLLTYGYVRTKIVTTETYIALVGTFALIVKEIVNDYFDQDRDHKQEVKP